MIERIRIGIKILLVLVATAAAAGVLARGFDISWSWGLRILCLFMWWGGAITASLYRSQAEKKRSTLRRAVEGGDVDGIYKAVIALGSEGVHAPGRDNGLLKQLVAEMMKRGWTISPPAIWVCSNCGTPDPDHRRGMGCRRCAEHLAN